MVAVKASIGNVTLPISENCSSGGNRVLSHTQQIFLVCLSPPGGKYHLSLVCLYIIDGLYSKNIDIGLFSREY